MTQPYDIQKINSLIAQDPDYFRRQSDEIVRAGHVQSGKKGGQAKSPGKGFGSNRALAIEAGRKGGFKSRRGGKVK